MRIRRFLPVVLSCLAVAAAIARASSSTRAAESPDPWKALEELRRGLAREGHLAADFVQTYLPAGFSSGDKENGHLALALPDCLRWDYDQPYPRSFLLCGPDAYAWNDGETSGRHFRVDAKEEPGLDLLLLPMDVLRRRYQAGLRVRTDGGGDIMLSAKSDAGSPLKATLALDRAGKTLRTLSYTDREGNLTRFEITGYRALAGKALFAPPLLAWQEQ